MSKMNVVSIGVDGDELKALESLMALVPATKESQELHLKAMPLFINLRTSYEEVVSADEASQLKKLSKKCQVEILQRVVDRQRWQISGLMVQALLSKQMSFAAGVNNTAVVAANLTDPGKVKLRCVYHGDFEVKPRNILAVVSHGKLKRLILREPVRPLKSSTKRLYFDVRSGFDALINSLQEGIQLFFRVHDSYAVNLFEYRLLRQGTFVLKDDSLTSEEYKDIRRIPTDFKFVAENYQRAFEKIETYEVDIAKFETSRQEVIDIDRQMRYFDDKYGNEKSL